MEYFDGYAYWRIKQTWQELVRGDGPIGFRRLLAFPVLGGLFMFVATVDILKAPIVLIDKSFKLFRPRWKYSHNPSARKSAVQELKDENTLIAIAQHDCDAGVRVAAVENPFLRNIDVLTNIVQT